MAKKLIPPDLERCQTEWTVGSFMTLGVPEVRRCRNRPSWIAREKRALRRGERRGSMSLCETHREALESQMPNYSDFKEIKLPKEGS